MSKIETAKQRPADFVSPSVETSAAGALSPTHSQNDLTYRFLDWRAKPSRNLLLHGDHEVRVTPRSMEVLVYLLTSRGRVVNKQELLREVWQGQAVTDDALIVTVYELRKALGDRAREPAFLETVPRRGYRFVPVVEIETTQVDAPPKERPGPGDSETASKANFSSLSTPQGGEQPSHLRRMSPAYLVLLMVFTGIIAFSNQRVSGDRQATSRIMSSNGNPSLEALHAEARKRLDLRTPKDLDKAQQAYRQILELLPDDARGQAGLARVAATRADLRDGDRFELYHESKSRAQRALAIDADLADAHLALGTTQLLLDWNLPLAAASLEYAVGQDPENPDGHQVLAWSHSAQGAHLLAETAARRSVELDPQSANRRADLAFLLLMGGHADGAIEEAEAALVLDEVNISAAVVLIRAHLSARDLNSAQAILLAMVSPPKLPTAESPLASLGFWALFERILPQLPDEEALTFRAGLSARAGELDKAFGFLEVAFARRSWEILWLEHLPELTPLREEARFKKLLRRRDSRQPAVI